MSSSRWKFRGPPYSDPHNPGSKFRGHNFRATLRPLVSNFQAELTLSHFRAKIRSSHSRIWWGSFNLRELPFVQTQSGNNSKILFLFKAGCLWDRDKLNGTNRFYLQKKRGFLRKSAKVSCCVCICKANLRLPNDYISQETAMKSAIFHSKNCEKLSVCNAICTNGPF